MPSIQTGVPIGSEDEAFCRVYKELRELYSAMGSLSKEQQRSNVWLHSVAELVIIKAKQVGATDIEYEIQVVKDEKHLLKAFWFVFWISINNKKDKRKLRWNL